MSRGLLSAQHALVLALRMISAAASSKPPNVLIYQPDKDSTDQLFLRYKKCLESCLTPERYVIYPLGEADIVQYSPWKDSCRFLVVPSLHMPSGPQECLALRVLEEVVKYVQEEGGSLLSFHPHLNAFVGCPPLQTSCVKGKHQGYVMETCKEEEGEAIRIPCLVPNADVPNYDFDDVYLGTPLTDSILETKDLLHWVLAEKDVDNTKQSNNNSSSGLAQHISSSHDQSCDICMISSRFAGEGRVVVSSVDFLPILPAGMELKHVIWLSGGVAGREQLLTKVLQGFGLECSRTNLPDLTSTFLLCSDERRHNFLTEMSSIQSGSIIPAIPGKDVSIHLITDDYKLGTPVDDNVIRPSTSEFPVIVRPAEWQVKGIPFSPSKYFKALKTRELGRTLLHTPVITSTMLPFTGNIAFCNAVTAEMGVVWVAGQQTQGKGRSGNAWISPLGSMMFTMPLPISPSSRLSNHTPLLQHIVGVAVVHGIRSLPGYEDVPIRIKWPNDIYHKSKVKLGGILVSCMTSGHDSTAIIGCGVNVCNAHPTISINDSIASYNKEKGTQLSPLSIEEVLARTCDTLEQLLMEYEVWGVELFLQLYYKYWLHSNASISLGTDGQDRATIVGIDQYGYLQVRTKTGDIVSLQPDGNSFDMIKGLITMKH